MTEVEDLWKTAEIIKDLDLAGTEYRESDQVEKVTKIELGEGQKKSAIPKSEGHVWEAFKKIIPCSWDKIKNKQTNKHWNSTRLPKIKKDRNLWCLHVELKSKLCW